jgi:hypothetical protein
MLIGPYQKGQLLLDPISIGRCLLSLLGGDPKKVTSEM